MHTYGCDVSQLLLSNIIAICCHRCRGIMLERALTRGEKGQRAMRKGVQAWGRGDLPFGGLDTKLHASMANNDC